MSLASTIRSHVSTNGQELAYVQRGTGAPVVLIMGLGADLTAWEQHVAAWERDFTCYAVDNRGAGLSSRPAGAYSTAEMANDYAGLIRSLDLGPVSVVGISMGGAIAQELALLHPDLVRSLVLVSSWSHVDAFAEDALRQLSDSRGVLDESAFNRMLQLLIWQPSHFDARRDQLRRDRTAAASTSVASFRSQTDACVAHDTRDRLHTIGVPVLVSAGDRDAFIPFELQKQLAEGIPDAELQVFPGGGHVHHWEELDIFNDTISRWLREH